MNTPAAHIRRMLPFLERWPHIGAATLRADAWAGLTNAIVVLPQGVAYALVAGLPPEYGLYTSMVPAVIAALFGSSWHLISGPTMAISITVFATLSPLADPGSAEYITLALTLTLLAGLYQLAFGVARLGAVVNFVSPAVVTGFTAGAALLIITSQLRHILGLDIPQHLEFFGIWHYAFTHVDALSPRVVAIAAATFAAAVTLRALRPQSPYLLAAMVIGALTGWLLDAAAHGVPVVGEIPRRPPVPSVPSFDYDTIRDLAAPALAVALLGLIEAVSIGRAIALRSQQQLDGNREFIGQGLSNIVGPFFSCYASSGSFTRSGINYEAGARTPLSAVIAAVSLMLIVIAVAPLTRYLPTAAMGGMIVLVAWNLIHRDYIGELIRASREDTAVLAVTFGATLLLDLAFAILAGVLLSLVLFLNRAGNPAVFRVAPDPGQSGRRFTNLERKRLTECPQLEIVRIDGAVFFGSVQRIRSALERSLAETNPREHLLVVGSGINYIDSAGAQTLVAEARRREARGGGLYLCSLKLEPRAFLEQSGYADEFGRDNLFYTKGEAVAEIVDRLDRSVCQQCSARIFSECGSVPQVGQSEPVRT